MFFDLYTLTMLRNNNIRLLEQIMYLENFKMFTITDSDKKDKYLISVSLISFHLNIFKSGVTDKRKLLLQTHNNIFLIFSIGNHSKIYFHSD